MGKDAILISEQDETKIKFYLRLPALPIMYHEILKFPYFIISLLGHNTNIVTSVNLTEGIATVHIAIVFLGNISFTTLPATPTTQEQRVILSDHGSSMASKKITHGFSVSCEPWETVTRSDERQ